jgi:4-amino-4-deoxy-L-arabinose transferase-like glycosyltransferase
LPELFIVKTRNAWYAGLILLVLLAVAVRIHLLALPLERDEGEFAYAGQLILQGIAPYKLVFNMKMPGTYAAYAVLMAVFGESPSGIHLGFLLVNLGTLALLFLVARRVLEGAAVPVCCAAYVLLSLSPAVLGLEGHATHLVVIHALGGLLLLLRARQSGKPLTFFLSGLLFGLAFLCKQPGLFFGIFGVAILLRDAMASRPVSWRSGARNISWL